MLITTEEGSPEVVYLISASFYLALEKEKQLMIPSFANMDRSELLSYIKTSNELALIFGNS